MSDSSMLHEQLSREPDFYCLGTPNNVIELSGITKAARHVLGNRPFVILYFPFRIGRISRMDPKSTARQDLLLPDYKPYNVSRDHLVFERENGRLFLIDETSTCGTLVDDLRIGQRTGVQNRVELPPGPHTIAVGGPLSPFLFRAEVRALRPSDYCSLDGDQPDRLPQARLLYKKLCRHESDLLSDQNLAPAERGKAAKGIAQIMVGSADLHEVLCCLAGNPIMGDDYLAQHSVNVTIFSIMLYRRLKYPVEEIITIAAGVLLHDTGMSMIDPAVTRKSARLSGSEYDLIKRHTVLGNELLNDSGDICTIASSMALDHHERIDGSGYPAGRVLLPELTRYLGLLDCFEALTHDRPHRQAYLPREAVSILTDRENRAYNMETRKAFLNTFSFFPVSSIVRLSTGEIGRVVGVNEGRPLSPVVRILQSQNSRLDQDGRLVDLSKQHLISITKEVTDRQLARKLLSEDALV
jgi:HD-GYP domain-containing protein (c-di-GMP phosphodiesterase class II)